MSVTALVGTNAQFHCAGTGNYLVWEVDGQLPSHPNIVDRGITELILQFSGTVQSNLTVPATSVNNGTTVRCAVRESLFSTPVISNYSILTVLPGEVMSLQLWSHDSSSYTSYPIIVGSCSRGHVQMHMHIQHQPRLLYLVLAVLSCSDMCSAECQQRQCSIAVCAFTLKVIAQLVHMHAQGRICLCSIRTLY